MPPTSPNNKFDFMLKNNQPAAKTNKLPLPNLPKPILYVIGVVLILIVVLLAFSLISGSKKGSYQPIIDAMARNQEIERVTDLYRPQLQDPGTAAIAATTANTLDTDMTRLNAYMLKNKHPILPKQLAGSIDKNSDAQLQTAIHNNNIDATYVSYLKTNLPVYAGLLRTAYKSSGTNAKLILNDAFVNTQTLLTSPIFKT